MNFGALLKMRKSFSVLALLTILILSGAAYMPQVKPKATNLKVLPKNISAEDLDKIMDQYKAALGVKCNYCHAPSKTDPKHLDFASDDKPAKRIARDMMKMTSKINSKFFKDERGEHGESMVAVSCITCHNGDEKPQVAMN